MGKYGRNAEGYSDNTAGMAIGRVSREERLVGIMADPKRQILGRRNRAVGDIFEKYISASCEYYWKQGYACIEKTPEPMRPLRPYGDRNTGQFIACYSKQAQPDFKGALCDGSCIIFDAKHTEKDRIQQNVITETQWMAFDKYEAMGAKCYVVVSIAMKNFYRVPWGVWKQMKELFGHKYMAAGVELEQYKVPDRNCTILFLEGVELRNEN